jgi:hypothetical protein
MDRTVYIRLVSRFMIKIDFLPCYLQWKVSNKLYIYVFLNRIHPVVLYQYNTIIVRL